MEPGDSLLTDSNLGSTNAARFTAILSWWSRIATISGVVVLVVLTVDAGCRLQRSYRGMAEIERSWDEQSTIWHQLLKIADRPPAGIDPREWHVRVMKVAYWSYEQFRTSNAAEVRRGLQQRLEEAVQRGRVDRESLDEWLEFVKSFVQDRDAREIPFDEYFDPDNKLSAATESTVGSNPPAYASASTGIPFAMVSVGEGNPTPFLAGVYEVTQGEYQAVMGHNPSYFQGDERTVRGQNTERFPVEYVSWYDAVEFCNKLSQADNLTPYYELQDIQRRTGSITSASVMITVGDGYRLPTGREWQVMSGARSQADHPVPANIDQSTYGGRMQAPHFRRPIAVGSYPPNELGLHDLIGNVWEWCEDSLDGSADRLREGGSWLYHPERSWFRSDGRNDLTGFRLVRTSTVVP